MAKGNQQSFRKFTNQKQLRRSEETSDQVQHLAGDASTDNRQDVTEPIEDTEALVALQANSGMFMHPMHDVTQTEHVNGDKVLQQLQVELRDLEKHMEPGEKIDPNET